MSAPSAIASQLGFKTEATVGTAVTVDTFHPGFLPGETMKQAIARIESKGIRAGRRVLQTWAPGAKTSAGSIPLELWSQPLATLLTHMFGSVTTTGDDAPYTHTATPGSLTGKSLTVQIGLPDNTGTVRTKTYAGAKVTDWEIACAPGEIAALTLGVSAMTEATDTALASASYPSGASPFTFVQGSLSIGGTDVATVKQLSLKGVNNLKTDRLFVGSATVKEQLETALREYAGAFTAEFDSLTSYGLYTAGTESALVLEFDNGTDSLTVTCNSRFDGETPVVSDMDVLEQPLPFTCLGTSDADAITAVLVNSESSAA